MEETRIIIKGVDRSELAVVAFQIGNMIQGNLMIDCDIQINDSRSIRKIRNKHLRD